jgi:hypothetical protein
MNCPNCGAADLYRDEVDVGVGIIYGPYGCPCGWSESSEYNQLRGAEARTDPWGGVYPAGNPVPWQPGMAPGEADVLYRLGASAPRILPDEDLPVRVVGAAAYALIWPLVALLRLATRVAAR